MSQTFLEDIPEFLEIQRDSFLRILDTGLIEAFDKINPIVPTSQCQYGLLFYPKEYVLILPENTITEAFLQGKTYGCKIFVPAVIYDIEKLSITQKKAEKRFKSVQTLRFTKITNARFSETSLFGFQEKNSNISVLRSTTNLLSNYRKGKKTANLSFSKSTKLLLNFELVFPLLKGLHSFFENKKTNRSLIEMQKQAAKVSGFSEIESYNVLKKSLFLDKKLKLNLSQRRRKWHLPNFLKNQPKKIPYWLNTIFDISLRNQTLNLNNAQTTTQLYLKLDPEVADLQKKSFFDNMFLEKQTLSHLFIPVKINQPIWKWTLNHKIQNRANINNGLVLSLETAQKTKKKLPFRIKSKKFELSTKINSKLPKNIRQKSKLGFFDKAPLWLRGRSNTSLLEEAIKSLVVFEEDLTVQKKKKPNSKNWFFPFATKSLINSKKVKDSYLLENLDKPSSKFIFNTMSIPNNTRLLSSKEWVCIGVLPLMTPRGHFIINGSHRIIISQMARAPGLYYQAGEKLQATIVPSKGAWLRISVKANETGEIKIWVRITPQRKMPYKIFIETYKFLENSKTILNPGGSKFLNLVYKNLNSKIKHLDKHYAIGVISSQINRTLFNPASYSLGSLGRLRLNERLGINDKNGYLTSKDLSKIKDNLLKLLGQKTSDLSADDIDHLENRRVRTCGELLQVEIDTGMTRLKKAIGKQLDEYSNPDSSIFNTFKSSLFKMSYSKEKKKENNFDNVTEPFHTQVSCSSEQTVVLHKSNNNPYKQKKNVYLLKHFNHQNFWHLYLTISEQNISFFKQQKSDYFWKKKKNLFFLKKSLYLLSRSPNSPALLKNFPLIFKQNKIGIIIADARLYKKKSCIIDKQKNEETSSSPKDFVEKNVTLQKNNVYNKTQEKVFLSPSKIIGTKAFAGALREFFGSNPLSQYMDQTNPLAEITHKRRLSSLGPGGVDRASAGIAIRGIHPSHYGRICPIETPEGKNAGLVNSMTMWARINTEGFLETPYFKVNGGSLMSHSHTLVPQWDFLSTKTESKHALKIVSSDLKITQSAFLPSIALPTRDGSERSFGRKKREVVHFCGISPMQNISVATSLIPFLEHDDATRALMGSNMQRQAVPLLKATAPLIRTGLEGKVVGESGHALQASCSGLISTVTRTFISIDSFDIIPKPVFCTLTRPRFFSKETNSNNLIQFSKISQLNVQKIKKNQIGQSKNQFIGCIKNLPFLKDLFSFSTQKQSSILPYNLQTNRLLEDILLSSTQKITLKSLSRNLWRKSEKIKRQRKIQNLQQYTRSNQATVCVQRPAVTEGRWVQKGDLIGDCSASKNGVLALGQNIVVAYLPMEGFNFEDAIVVSDRLVREELYTSIHVQRIEFDLDAVVKKYIPRKIKVKKQKSAYKTNTQDWITFYNPHLLQSEKQNLNPLGIIKVGSWVGPGDVLVSKVIPVERKIAPSRHLLAAVFQEKKTKILDTDDTSIRVPKGIHGRVINVKIIGTGKNASESLMKSCAELSLRKKKNFSKSFSPLYEANNSLKQEQLVPTSTIFFNSEQTQRSEKGEQGLPLLEKSTTVNKANAFNQKSSNNNASRFSGRKSYFFNTDSGPNSIFLEYKARKMKTLKSWSYASALENSQFIVNFGTLPSIFQLFPNKESLGYSSSRLLNLISYSNFLEINESDEEKHDVFFKKTEKDNRSQINQNKLLETLSIAENQPNFFGKRSNPIAKTFIDLTAKDQALTLTRKKLPSIIIKNYYESISNCIPSLLRRIVFRELITNCLPITQFLEPFQLKFDSTKNFILPSNSTSTTFFNKPEFFEKFQDSVKSKEMQLSSNSFVKYYNEDLINFTRKKSINSQDYKITGVRIYIAERKKLQVGDKMSGRHGNKGIVSTILPREDMPYLPDGTPIDMVLNPLGIPSRMNVGQVFECLLGLAASICNKSIGHTPFDEMYGPEASRSLVYLFLYVSRLRSRADWLFQPNFPGKTVLFDGRTGTPFEQWVTVGRAYMLKLIHMVDEKIHARSIGPRSLVTQQPVKGRARGGGQRLGEMEIWALEGFGAAYILQEILTIKSDDIIGRENVETSIISATSLSCSIPETFRITLFELRCLCLNIELTQNF